MTLDLTTQQISGVLSTLYSDGAAFMEESDLDDVIAQLESIERERRTVSVSALAVWWEFYQVYGKNPNGRNERGTYNAVVERDLAQDVLKLVKNPDAITPSIQEDGFEVFLTRYSDWL
jgi:hypothetical protein